MVGVADVPHVANVPHVAHVLVGVDVVVVRKAVVVVVNGGLREVSAGPVAPVAPVSPAAPVAPAVINQTDTSSYLLTDSNVKLSSQT